MTGTTPAVSGPRPVHAPRGSTITCKGWQQEAALRMLMNNLDPDVAERPDELVVYGGTGKAARSWDAFDAIVAALRALENDETLLVQSGKPVAVFLRLESPVIFDAADAMPVDLVFGLLSPELAGTAHLHALAAISRTMRDEHMHAALLQATDAEVLYGLLSNVIDRDAA